MHPVSAYGEVRIVIRFIPEHSPGHACRFVGQGHRGHVWMSSLGDLSDPATEPVVFVFCNSHHRSGAVDQQRTQVNTPCVRIDVASFYKPKLGAKECFT